MSFPKLVNSNLIGSDFFSDKEEFNQKRFDIVIGNPPWKSQLTELATRYITTKKKVVGDNQIALAFSIKCIDLCKETGTICLLMPSKGFLFNRSKKSSQYRKDFLTNNTVSTIINFSIYRKLLFDHASGSAVAVIYFPVKPSNNHTILYCTPKPQFTVQDTKKFSIEPTDICQIPLDIVHDDRIWKIAMWGGPRDLELIDRVQSTYPPLDKFTKINQMCSAEGFKRGNRSKVHDDLKDIPFVSVDSFIPFYFEESKLDINDDATFERVSIKNQVIFKPPHLVIKQSHKKARFLAAVLDYDAIFNHSFLGIHGDINLLKYLCLIINSKLFSYYQLMTSRTWMVERDALEAGDIRSMPIIIPNEKILNEAKKLFEYIVETKDESSLDAFINKIYQLKQYEVSMIDDALDYIYNYFDKKDRSIVFDAPSKELYSQYNKTLIDVLQNTFGKLIVHESHFFIGDSPLTVLMLSLDGKCSEIPQFHTETSEIQLMLENLDTMLTEERQNIFIRRNVRIYGTDAIYIVKPMQKKYWNYSSACRDGDEIFADIMNAWRCSNE